jgi:hypothetical protein
MRKFIVLMCLVPLLNACGAESAVSSDSSVASGSGQGGSTARFTILNGNLYVALDRELHAYDLSVPSAPKLLTSLTLNDTTETIYPYQGHLLLGGNNGMQVYQLNAQGVPSYLSSISHFRACDPVVAENGYAYVTLQNASAGCWGTVNQMDIVDMSDLNYPFIVKSITMSAPKGLAIADQQLFVCDANNLIEYDITHPTSPQLQNIFNNINCNDVMLRDGNLVVTGDNELSIMQRDQSGMMVEIADLLALSKEAE